MNNAAPGCMFLTCRASSNGQASNARLNATCYIACTCGLCRPEIYMARLVCLKSHLMLQDKQQTAAPTKSVNQPANMDTTRID